MSKFLKFGLIVVMSTFVVGLIIFAPTVKSSINDWRYNIQKVDDVTNYETIKKVEDTCRAMISSYNSDKLRYEQYSKSEDKEERSWGEQAKMRANTTASSYNNYILKNNYVWKENVPSDVYMALEYLE